ncbi:RidA family protein [Labrys wisconsinensis]|uniref:Enamine deaminase RidA (YjgF/YER057c/UK114 family) n=1 Tax=Labrys wisconsinensis TaxID=425677 RepID=A0ABU0JJA4_9HYPH|nr:RidA family protein [Labrys wisconsinensis]MDQ0474371.1 enamine deaminase RidA (YjgF/YER057c/UK114 family) [Labrys wisconsinensis]
MTITRFENGTRYCRALSHNGTVYLSGMTADDTSGDTVQQTRDTLAKIERYLQLAGSDKSKLLSAVIWLRDIADFELMNSVWDRWIDPAAMPVRATVEARLAGDAYRVEIMVVAAA